MDKSTVRWLIAVVCAAVMGAVLMRVYYAAQTVGGVPTKAQAVPMAETLDFHGAELPEGMEEAEPEEPVNAAEISSQLVPISLPDVVAIEKPAEMSDEEQLPTQASSREVTPVDLKSGKDTVVPLTSLPQENEGDETSKISMIQAPVKFQTIKTLEGYKLFKQKARGKYPEVDFNKDMVILLESDSNLPDNMFEFVDVTPENDRLLVTYRVTVIGLNKKTNTHSVHVTKKTDKKIELKQVI